MARQIASALGMDEIHQVCNAGVKLLVGIPPSFRSGTVILARKGLGLERLGAVKLPGSGWGWCWDHVSLQFAEHRYALFGRIQWKGKSLLVVGTHLHHTRALDDVTRQQLARVRDAGKISSQEYEEILTLTEQQSARRLQQVRAIEAYLETHAPETPAILAGDFNAEPDSEEIRELVRSHGFIDTYAEAGTLPGFTWDPERNTNVAQSLGSFLELPTSNAEAQRIMKDQDLVPSRVDYIFLNRYFTPDQVLTGELFAAQPVTGDRYCSDHFGVLTTIQGPSQ